MADFHSPARRRRRSAGRPPAAAPHPPRPAPLRDRRSVDDGKSTLVGRLLHDSKSVLADQLEAVQRASVEKGLATPDLSLLVDGLRAEREQGITIDVAYRYFSTPGASSCSPTRPGTCSTPATR